MERIILSEANFSRLREIVKKNSDKEIVFTSNDDDLNRKVIEKLPIQILLIPLEERKDYMKQRNSGFNEVMARVMKEKGIKLGLNLDEIIDSKNKERILARLKQNIFLCNKFKIKVIFLEGKYKRNFHELKSLLLVLGLHNSLY